VGRKAKVHERETRRNKVVELASEASSAEWDERVGWRKGTVVVEER
jgi:predicted nucleic acid-binding Zn ribbon protein